MDKLIIKKIIIFLNQLLKDIEDKELDMDGDNKDIAKLPDEPIHEIDSEVIRVIKLNKVLWHNIPVSFGNLRQVSLSMNIVPTQMSDIVIGTCGDKCESYGALVTSTRFNTIGYVDSFNKHTESYINDGIKYSEEEYEITTNIDLDSKLYQSFINGKPVSKPLILRNDTDVLKFLSIRANVDVEIYNVKVKPGTVLFKQDSVPVLEDDDNVVDNGLIKNIYSTSTIDDERGFRA